MVNLIAVEPKEDRPTTKKHKQMREVINLAVVGVFEHSVPWVSNAPVSALRHWLQAPRESISVFRHLTLPESEQRWLVDVLVVPVRIFGRLTFFGMA